MTATTHRKFPLGRVVMTPGIQDAILRGELTTGTLAAMVVAHASGDWGLMDAADTRQNNWAVKHGARIMSAYPFTDRANELGTGIGDGVAWVITEADRSVTTILLPDEY